MLFDITATHVSVAIAAASLAIAWFEHRRAKAAEQRELRAGERAERAERREEERHAREVADAEARRRADLVVDVRSISSERQHFLVNMYLRNVGAVPARQVSIVVVDGEGMPRCEPQKVTD